MPDNTKSAPYTTNTYARKNCFCTILLILTWFWIIFVVIGSCLAFLVLSSISLQTSNWNYAMVQAGMGVLLALPLLLLTLFWRTSHFRATYQTWLLGSVFVIILTPVHLLPETAAQLQALIRIFLASVYIILIFLLSKFNRNNSQDPKSKLPRNYASWLIAILIATIFAYPWLAWGALGSLLDTILQVIFGFILGLATFFTIAVYLLPALFKKSSTSKREYIFGGFSIGITLLIMSGGTAFPYGGMQLLLITCLPTLGWALTAFYQSGRSIPRVSSHKTRWLPATLLIGFSAAAPMAFIDPDELLLLTSAKTGEIFQWAFYSAGISAIIGLGASLILAIVVFSRWTTSGLPKYVTSLLGAIAIFALLLGGWIHIYQGQPGFYGEGLFVILKNQADTSPGRYIENYFERRQFVYHTLTEHAKDTQDNLRKLFDRFGIDYTPYYLVNGLHVQGGPLLRIWLEGQPGVDRVLDNPWLRPLPSQLPIESGIAPAPNDPTWNLRMINADRVWDDLGVNGAGIVIGQSDSGVDNEHLELAVNYRGRNTNHDFNWFDPWNKTTKPIDVDGHGTHSLGIIVGQHVGVAPQASWYGCVNLARNLGNSSLYLDCMQFMLAPFPIDGDPFADGDPKMGAHISNNSWGCPEIEGCDPGALLSAVRSLRNAGIFVVASAGNDGPKCGTLTVPISIYEEVYSVGSVDQFGQLSNFSSLGPVNVDGSGRIKPNITAPGDEVLSSMPYNTYEYRSGTSFAGPHVAGVVALMWSANPMLIGDIENTEKILALTAQPYTGILPACEGADSNPSTAVGYGIVDAYAAVTMALETR